MAYVVSSFGYVRDLNEAVGCAWSEDQLSAIGLGSNERASVKCEWSKCHA